MTATLLLQVAVKATLVLLGGLMLTRAMSRTSAAARHLVWVLALGSALAVSLMHVAGPSWTLAVLPQSTEPGSLLTDPTPVPLANPAASLSVVPDALTARTIVADDIEIAEVFEPVLSSPRQLPPRRRPMRL
jgi:hypothetical protein